LEKKNIKIWKNIKILEKKILEKKDLVRRLNK